VEAASISLCSAEWGISIAEALGQVTTPDPHHELETTGENFGLDLTNFLHQQGNLKFEIEF
jgi:hypothetical protein